MATKSGFTKVEDLKRGDRFKRSFTQTHPEVVVSIASKGKGAPERHVLTEDGPVILPRLQRVIVC